SLLPPGEGGRDGRMRVPGPYRSHVLEREVNRDAKALIHPFGAPSPGGEGGPAPPRRRRNGEPR
ncbi:MAG: hypothetical protein WKF75_13290, partial [Singulisphaera sp.]